MRMSLAEVADITDGCFGANSPGETLFSSVSIDSRTVANDSLYVAIVGERLDGHRFISAAADAGAVAALVSDSTTEYSLPTVQVEDTQAALSTVAKQWRQQCQLKAVALTGSMGKTTCKEMLAAILAVMGSTHATKGNLNNHIGVPLTLLGLESDHRYLVAELGASGPGEIADLVALVIPDVVVLLNASEAHLQGFGSLVGVAQAKGEIVSGVSRGGTVILNRDDPFFDAWKALVSDATLTTFGFNEQADVTVKMGHSDVAGSEFELCTAKARTRVKLSLPGQHNIVNAMAATAAALAMGATLEQVKQGLEHVVAAPGRLQWKNAATGLTILDDSYNANPASIEAAVSVLMESDRLKWAVIGGMGELGEASESLHRALGQRLAGYALDRLLVYGESGRRIAEGYGKTAEWFATQDQLQEALIQSVSERVALLVKGSRSEGLEKVINTLLLGRAS